MDITTEQELINEVFPDDNTKTINDVIQKIVEDSQNAHTSQQIKDILKSSLPSVNWSF
tara:strand:+ start:713 stop:886 length:174 start_codon:yes stop_codon:yes gene_type:complete